MFNFLDRERDLALAWSGAARLRPLLDSDSAAFGGGAQGESEAPTAERGCLRLTLPPYSGRLYQVE